MRARLIGLCVAALCLGTFSLTGCGDDTTPNDMTVVTKNDDMHAPADMTATGTDSCLTIATCAQACTTQACINTCLSTGSASALMKFGALTACGYGVCETPGADGGAAVCASATDQSTSCAACVGTAAQSSACQTQLIACASP